jgi:hypothetical protein
VQIDRVTGLLRTKRGVSIQSDPIGLERFGGAWEVTFIPPELHIVKVGKKPNHYEIAPASPMTFEEYEDALARVTLTPPTTDGETNGDSN